MRWYQHLCLLHQISTRLLSAKALWFWREERSHKLSDADRMWSYVLMFAKYYESKFAWSLTFSLDLFSCYLNSFAQCRLPDFRASTHLSDKFSLADTADDATVTRCSKHQEEYPIEDDDRLAFLHIMTSVRSLGCCRIKTWRITSRFRACLHLMCMFVCAKCVAGKWMKHVGAHAQMGLHCLKLAQALTRVKTPFLSVWSQWLCCLNHCPRPCIRTLPNSKSWTLKSGTLV